MTDIAGWQERLSATFGHGGVIGQELILLDEAESRYGAWVADTFRGFMALSEAFLVFHFGLPELLNEHLVAPMKKTGTSTTPTHQFGLLRHATDFRVLRASRHLLFAGCPYEGTALLRPVFDAALTRTAIMQGVASLESVEGIVAAKPGEPIDFGAARKARIKEERRIDEIMVGENSGLSESTREELAKWEGLLHAEIHGARVSQADALDWLSGKSPLRMMPHPASSGAAMLMNRWVEVAWLVHRLMPTLQLPGYGFPREWAQKWVALDESFEPMVQSLSSELGKKIGNAMVELVRAKFPFAPESACRY